MPESDRPTEEELRARVTAARNAALDALREWEQLVFQHGYHSGVEATNKGWMDILNRAVTEFRVDPAQPVPALTSGSVSFEHDVSPAKESIPYVRRVIGPTGAGTRAADLVLQAIDTSHKGMRGVEIVDKLQADGTPVQERTVRTALHRLKRAGLIRIVDGRWFPARGAPASTSSSQGD